MNSSINDFNPFQTITGYNQVNELKNFIVSDTCVITMKDIWELYCNRFPKNVDVSMMPSIVAANTNAPAMAIADKATDMLLS